jgi:MEDS: MEthanogen/methylotroph, DcmR Sensory domain
VTEAVGVLPERWDGHTVLLYENEEERLTAVGAFVRRGVERGEKVLLAVAPDDDGEAFLASCLTTPVAASARGTGQVALLPLGEFYPPVGQHEVAARALAQGYPGVRLTAPATGALTVMSPTDYLALEHATDERCRSGTVSALCQYAHSSWRGHLLPETLAAHRDGLRSPVLDVEATTGGVRVSGEVEW